MNDHQMNELAEAMNAQIKTAFKIVAADGKWCEASVFLNGHDLNPTDCPDLELLRLVAQHPPIREQLEAVRDMIVEALAENHLHAEAAA